MRNIINLLLLFGVNLIVVDSSSDTGPIGPVTLHEIKDCSPPLDMSNATIVHEKDVDQKYKATVSFNVPFDVGEDAMLSFDASKRVGSGYEKSAFVLENQLLFKFLNDFAPKIWNDLRDTIKPKILNPMKIEKGEYHLEKFYANNYDISSPQVMYGQFLVDLIISIDDEDVFCKNVDIELKPPSYVM